MVERRVPPISLGLGLLLALAVLPLLGCGRPPDPTPAQTACRVPVAGVDRWPVGPPESVGLKSDSLCQVAAWLGESTERNVHAVLVARHGRLVFEQYFAGPDEIRGSRARTVVFGPEIKHDLRSVTKAVVALLTGMAIDRGLITSVDAPVLSFFPEVDTAGLRGSTHRTRAVRTGGAHWAR